MKNIISKDYNDITENYYLDKWKEAAALIISNA